MQGLVSDFLGKRAPVLAVSLLLAMGALVGYSRKYLYLCTIPGPTNPNPGPTKTLPSVGKVHVLRELVQSSVHTF